VDPTAYTGQGYGLAPIGHSVAVYGATSVAVDVVLTMTLATGVVYTDIQAEVEAAIEEYMVELRKSWEDLSAVTVRRSAIEVKLLAIEEITEITDITLNGSAANLTLTATQVPVLGNVTKS
jgi:low affinity Fe/Cu permease